MSYIVYVSKFRLFRKRYAYIFHLHPFQETKARFFSSFLALIVMIERSMDHGESRGPALLAVAVAFLVLTWVTVSLRFYVRIFVSHSTGGDDWIMLIALMLYTIYCGLEIAGIYDGTGQKQTLHDITSLQRLKAVELWFVGELFYNLAAGFARVSVAIFLLRITVERSHEIVLWATTVVVILTTAFFFFFTLLECSPVDYFWKKYFYFLVHEHGTCWPRANLITSTYVVTAIAAAADLVYALAPVAMLWHAIMNKKAKIVVTGILALGATSGIAVISRLTLVSTLGSPISTWLYDTIDLAIWSTIEPGLGITAGSLATLRPLVRKLKANLRNRRDSDSRKTPTIGSPRRKPGSWKVSRITSSSAGSRPCTVEGVDIYANRGFSSPASDGTLVRPDPIIARDPVRMNRPEEQEMEVMRVWAHRRDYSGDTEVSDGSQIRRTDGWPGHLSVSGNPC